MIRKARFNLPGSTASGSRSTILWYEGDLSLETSRSILTTAEQMLAQTGAPKRMFNVVVEALQNIAKHGVATKTATPARRVATFGIGYEQCKYSVMSGNAVRNENITQLRDALERIKRLDKNGLNNLYRKIITNTTLSGKTGGLGFVDMARRSGEKLDWSFTPMNEEFSFFRLKIKIGRSKE